MPVVTQNPQAAGGGSQPVQLTTVTVTSADLLGIGGTPKVLIPGVPGFITNVMSTVMVYKPGGTPYGNLGNVQFEAHTPYAINTGSVFGWFGNNINGSGFLDAVTDQVAIPAPSSDSTNPSTDAADLDGQDVVLVNTVPAQSPTGGDGELLVTLVYYLAPTS